MKSLQVHWTAELGWMPENVAPLPGAQVVFLFGSSSALKNGAMSELRAQYPDAHLFGCSTAGEIMNTRVYDDSLVATAVRFDSTHLEVRSATITDAEDSFEAGVKLAGSLDQEELVHVLILSDGLKVNGSELVRGVTSALPDRVTVTGGLSGDGSRFMETLVMAGGRPEANTISAMGFYGASLQVSCASLGGWDSFGPERLVTKSDRNVVYELDGKPALELYKQYLGDHAAGLPATGLLFPLSVRIAASAPVVRTILAVGESDGSLTFAGDVPRGSHARLMKANVNRLIEGAHGAADACQEPRDRLRPDLALLISCVGRKLVLKQRVEEEVEAVREVFGPDAAMTGFYSYGEISPFTPTARCELHNQTMTITTFSEG